MLGKSGETIVSVDIQLHSPTVVVLIFFFYCQPHEDFNEPTVIKIHKSQGTNKNTDQGAFWTDPLPRSPADRRVPPRLF